MSESVQRHLENGNVVQIVRLGDNVLFQGFRPSEDGMRITTVCFSVEATMAIRDALNEMFPPEKGEAE